MGRVGPVVSDLDVVRPTARKKVSGVWNVYIRQRSLARPRVSVA